MSFANVGRRWSTSSFPGYLTGLKRPAWADSVCIHYTGSPSLAMRPHGFTAQHIENIANYYQRDLRWKKGYHFLTDEDDIFGMTPPTQPGTHAIAYNGRSIGISALGNYDFEDPRSGRGLAVMQTTASTARAAFEWLGVKPSSKTLFFHRFDPRTTKTCPGTKVHHDWFLEMVLDAKPGEITPTAEPDTGGPASLRYVPVVNHVAAATGRSIADLAAMLRREDDLFYLGEHWVEGARYNVNLQATEAPLEDVEEVVFAMLQKPASGDGRVPVVATMAARLGISFADAARCLKSTNQGFTWNGKLIPGALYDRATQTTLAPESSLKPLK